MATIIKFPGKTQSLKHVNFDALEEKYIKIFSKNFRYLTSTHKVDCFELAEILNCDITTVWEYAMDQRYPSKLHRRKISEIFERSEEQLCLHDLTAGR